MLTWDDLEVACAVAATSVTIAKSSLFEPLRTRAPKSLAKLLSCPYCLSHWFAAVVALGLGLQSFIAYAVTVMALVALSAIIMGAMIQLLMIGEHEAQELRDEVNALELELQLEEQHSATYRRALEELAK